jgi:hydroxymethylpyrimidine/phosphomethylpyrimidine kinase
MSRNDPLSPPVALTIAGSDCSAGAGAQADLKVFRSFGVYGLTAITCVVAETPREVGSVHPVPPSVVAEQVALLLSSYPVAAIKTGMLFSRAHIEAVAAAMDGHPAPLVVDPVMMASTGDSLIERDAVSAYRSLLFPRATVITPNIDEAARLAGEEITTREHAEASARRLFEKYGTAVVVKGGHLKTKRCHDFLCGENLACWLDSERLDTPASHGTGCTFAAAMAACLAHGEDLVDSFKRANSFVFQALTRGFVWNDPEGRPIHALNQNAEKERRTVR